MRTLIRTLATILTLVTPLVAYQALLAECTDMVAETSSCPDTTPSCAVQPNGQCDGPGSIIYDAPWECRSENGSLTDCLTATVPPGTFINNPICYSTYLLCKKDQATGFCVPDTTSFRQDYRRVIKDEWMCDIEA